MVHATIDLTRRRSMGLYQRLMRLSRDGDVMPGPEARSMGSKSSSGAHKWSALIRRRFRTQEFRCEAVRFRRLGNLRATTKLRPQCSSRSTAFS
jgi:hypothetical protein